MATTRNRSSWKSGQSGNPKGRPKGSGLTVQLRQLLDPHQHEIIDQLVALAKGGDMTAISLLMRYLYPPSKPTHESVSLGTFGDSLAEKARGVWDAVARGEIAPDIGEKLMAMLSDVCKIADATELVAMVNELRAEVDELNRGIDVRSRP